jgi:hypothetical protein
MAEQLRGSFEKFVDSPYYSEEDSGTGGFESTNFSNGPRTSMMNCNLVRKLALSGWARGLNDDY